MATDSCDKSSKRKYPIKVGIIGGSGLDNLAEYILDKSEAKPKHETELGNTSSPIVLGTIHDTPVAIILRHGEGHAISPSNVNYRANIESLKALGCTHILATTACGSLSEDIAPGQLAIPDSFIDRTYLRKNTFYDGSISQYKGVRHVPMEPAFHRRTSDIVIRASEKIGASVRNGGTMVTIEGPRFSSKAESKMFRKWGGDLVNMTTCPEVFLAKEAGILYTSIAMVTDYDCWKDSDKSVCVANVMEVFRKNVDKVTPVLAEAVKFIGELNWDRDIDDLKILVAEALVSKTEKD